MTVRSQAALPQAGSQSHPAFAPQRRFFPKAQSHRKPRLLLTALLIPLSPTSLAAQDTLKAGDKVRVLLDSRQVVGTVSAVKRDTLVLEDVAFQVPLSSVSRLEVSTGQKSHWLVGAVVGLGLGAAATAAFLVAFCDSGDSPCQGDEYVNAFAIIAVPPTIVGAIIGALIKSERWEEVSLDAIHISITPITPHGFGATLRVTLSR